MTSQNLQEMKKELRNLSDRLLHALATPKSSYEDFCETFQRVEDLKKQIYEPENS